MQSQPFNRDRVAHHLRIWLPVIIPWALAVMTAGVIAVDIPSRSLFSVYANEILIYCFLTAVVLFFEVWLSEGGLSPAHVVGMSAFLSLPQEAYPLTTWAIFTGGVIGAYALNLRTNEASQTRSRRIRNIIFVTARVTLGFFAAGQIYIALDGILPLQTSAWAAEGSSLYVSIAVYALVYMTLYFSVFILELYVNRRPVNEIINTNISLILVVMLLPVPFAILNAEIVDTLSVPSQVISVMALPLIVLGLHALSRSEYQLRKQLNELRTLSVVTRAVRAHLELDTLLKTIYLQVGHLLDAQNFVVALHNRERGQLEFALIIRHGQEEDADTQTKLSVSQNKTLITYVMEMGVPLLISHDVHDAARALNLEPPGVAVESWLGVPLMAGGRKLGIMAVFSEEPGRHFGQNDLRLLNIVAASASIAIENAQLYRQQTERVEQLATLNNIAALLSGTLSPDTVLDTIISSASTIAQANAVAVYLFWDESQENLPLVRSAGFSTRFTDTPPVPLLRQIIDETPLHQRKPVVVDNIATDKRAMHLRGLVEAERKASFIEVPVAVGEKALGIITMYFNEVQAFSGEQIELLRTFATQAAQAIQNARTYAMTDEAFQRSVEQLLALASIGRVLTSTIDLKTICGLILDNAIDATHVDVGVVALYTDNEGKKLEIMAHQGYPGEVMSDTSWVEKGIRYRALATGQTQLVPDVQKDPDYVRLAEFTRALLSVPIMRGRDALGYITLESVKTGGFSMEDSQFVSQIANQAIIAIENARLFARITEARDRLQVILDTMEEGIILIDAGGRIALANPRMKMVGLQPEKLLNHHVNDALMDESSYQGIGFKSKEDIETLLRDLQAETWNSYEPHLYSTQHEKGTAYIQRFIIPIPDEQGKTMGALLVFYDKTEEQELARAREELSRMIVHDLRSPLTAVTTSLKLLHDFVPAESDFASVVQQTTDTSRRAIRKLLNRVDSLLDISKMESGRLAVDPDLTELPTLADNVCAELSPLAHELEINILSEIRDDTPLLNIDADKVERLLLNLVDNALKYSPTKSKVYIRSYMPGEKGAPEGFIRLDVIDSGPGIPDEYRETLFDSFVQVEGRKKVRRGVGLGLTFCKLVAEAHQGRIWIEDNPKGGSIFAVTLPVAKLERLPEDEDEFPITSAD